MPASDQADEERVELQAYLGARFDEQQLLNHRAVVEASSDLDAFYKSDGALYDLTAFAMGKTKVPYHAALRRVVAAPAKLLDYGCGTGSDGLRFLEEGYRVSFADFDGSSTQYLRWRLERRGHLDSQVYDIDDSVPGGFDLAFAFDVIDFAADPFEFLGKMERRADLVAFNVVEDPPEKHLAHKPLPIGEVVEHARRHGLVYFRRFYGRSNLLIYRSAPVGPTKRLQSHAIFARARLERAIGRQ